MAPASYYTGFGQQGPSPARRALRALVVDDERDTVLTLLLLLGQEGYEARGAYDGQSGLREAESFDPDAVIVDIAMPGMSGWDVARELRRRHRSRPMLIAISGEYVRAPDELLSRVAGFSHFFIKPCDPNRLLQTLSAVVLSTP